MPQANCGYKKGCTQRADPTYIRGPEHLTITSVAHKEAKHFEEAKLQVCESCSELYCSLSLLENVLTIETSFIFIKVIPNSSFF